MNVMINQDCSGYFLENKAQEGETRSYEVESIQSHFDYAMFFEIQD